MSDVLLIAGSPSLTSRSTEVLQYLGSLLEAEGVSAELLKLRDLPAEDLLYGQYDAPSIRESTAKVQQAQAIVVATPVYKAAYTGILKTFLDVLPQHALAGKLVLPIATGGSPAHLLSIDYALKPVLSALGAEHILSGIYAVDAQIQRPAGESIKLDQEIALRLNRAIHALTQRVFQTELSIGR